MEQQHTTASDAHKASTAGTEKDQNPNNGISSHFRDNVANCTIGASVRGSLLTPSVSPVAGQSGNWAVRLGSTEVRRFVSAVDALRYFDEYAAEGWVPCGLNIFDVGNRFEMWPFEMKGRP